MYIRAAYSENFEDKKIAFDFNSSGSGFMQVLQILAPIYTVCPNDCKIVLLDEPDAHLHPNMQIALAKSLQKIQKELGIQIIISTHSAAIIKTAKPSNIVPITSSNDVCRPLSDEEDVEEQIAQLDNFELAKSVISGKMVFIEDTNTDILEAVDKLLGTKVFYGANTVSVHRGRGKDDKLPFQIKPLLKDFLKKDIEIVFIRDSDGLSVEWKNKLIDYAESRDVKLFLFDRYEIENYILDGELIQKTLRKKFPQKTLPSTLEIEDKIYEYLKNTVIMSKYKYDDNLEDSIFKISLIINDQSYRNTDVLKHEAERIRSMHENQDSLEILKKVGMGKEALKQLFNWLNSELKLNLSKDDILENMEVSDISPELKDILEELQSLVLCKKDVNTLELYDEEMEDLEKFSDESSVEEIIQLVLPL